MNEMSNFESSENLDASKLSPQQWAKALQSADEIIQKQPKANLFLKKTEEGGYTFCVIDPKLLLSPEPSQFTFTLRQINDISKKVFLKTAEPFDPENLMGLTKTEATLALKSVKYFATLETKQLTSFGATLKRVALFFKKRYSRSEAAKQGASQELGEINQRLSNAKEMRAKIDQALSKNATRDEEKVRDKNLFYLLDSIKEKLEKNSTGCSDYISEAFGAERKKYSKRQDSSTRILDVFSGDLNRSLTMNWVDGDRKGSIQRLTNNRSSSIGVVDHSDSLQEATPEEIKKSWENVDNRTELLGIYAQSQANKLKELTEGNREDDKWFEVLQFLPSQSVIIAGMNGLSDEFVERRMDGTAKDFHEVDYVEDPGSTHLVIKRDQGKIVRIDVSHEAIRDLYYAEDSKKPQDENEKVASVKLTYTFSVELAADGNLIINQYKRLFDIKKGPSSKT